MRGRQLYREGIMRPAFAATVLLAASLVASAGLAASDKATATFETLGTSIFGDVTLHQYTDPDLRVHLRANLKGLEPNTGYAAVIYPNMFCGAGTSTQILTFTANAAGNATWNAKTSIPLVQIGSIGLVLEKVVVACAVVLQ
jgi:hypothetical protein